MRVTGAWAFLLKDNRLAAKLAAGVLLSLIPFVFLGYLVNVARGVMRGDEHPLPGARSFGRLFVDGWIILVTLVAYFLPLAVFVVVFGEQGKGFGTYRGPSLVCYLSLLDFSRTIVVPPLVLGLVVLPYVFVVGMFFLLAVLRYADSGHPAVLVGFRTMPRDLRRFPGTVLRLWLYAALNALLTALFGAVAIITCIGPFVVFFVNNVAMGHLIGQAGRIILRPSPAAQPAFET
jgi:hypothetical protein